MRLDDLRHGRCTTRLKILGRLKTVFQHSFHQAHGFADAGWISRLIPDFNNQKPYEGSFVGILIGKVIGRQRYRASIRVMMSGGRIGPKLGGRPVMPDGMSNPDVIGCLSLQPLRMQTKPDVICGRDLGQALKGAGRGEARGLGYTGSESAFS